MTEQQIDAELIRYEPYQSHYNRTWFSWWHEGPDPSDLPTHLFALLSNYCRWETDVRFYPTREAAFADLRRAIAASDCAHAGFGMTSFSSTSTTSSAGVGVSATVRAARSL